MLKIGDIAPDFKDIPNQDGELVSLSDFKGKKLILFFYPKANTVGCTKEVCNLEENYNFLSKNNYKLLGVSADSPRKQRNFKNKFCLSYDLLADKNKYIINKYGVWGEKKFMGRSYQGIIRTTFVINEESIIDNIINKVDVLDHTSQILKNN